MRGQDNDIAVGDLHLAAFLISKGINLSRLERAGRLGTFYFPQSAGPFVSEYTSRHGLIEPIAFVAAVRSLRAKVDNAREGGGR